MSSASNINNLSNAIKRGAEKGDLNLPKGIGGRVKGPAKVSPAMRTMTSRADFPQKTADKENVRTALPAGGVILLFVVYVVLPVASSRRLLRTDH